MNIEFDVTNRHYSQTGQSFNMDQLPNGLWTISIDGNTIYEGEFAPTNIQVTEN